jgi:phasin family protein
VPELTLSGIAQHVGKELGVSTWVTVDQSRINQFAECSGDRQWIHVDVARAKRESPYRAPIAHGYLTLALVAPLQMEIGAVPTDAGAAFNYGLDKVRFLAPVKAGDRVRLRVALINVEQKSGGVLLKTSNILEIEGSDKPALIAESLALITPRNLCETRAHKEEEVTTESFMDQIKAFGARLGLPEVDVDKLVDIQLKNIDALGRSAQAAGEGAKALADKQREIIEAAFKETSAMVRDYHPVGDPQATLAKQKDYAKRAFELTMQNTRDVADLTKKTTTEATTIIRDRLRESLAELRESVSRSGSEEKKG